MSLVNNATREFTSKVRSRGADYCYSGLVTLSSTTPTAVTAIVKGSEDYEVKIDWSRHAKGELEVACTCPYYFGEGPCKHIWATILEIDRKRLANNVYANRRLELVLDVIDDGEEDDLVDTLGDFPQNLPANLRREIERRLSFPPAKAKRSDTRWRSQFSELQRNVRPAVNGRSLVAPSRCEAWFVLSLDLCLGRGLVIELFQRTAKRDGQLGRHKPLGLSFAGITQWKETPEYPLLKTLLLYDQASLSAGFASYSSYYSDYSPVKQSIALDPLAFSDVLPKLCETGRFGWRLSQAQTDLAEARPINWDDGPPWQFQLHVAADDKARQWVLSGRLVRPGVATPLLLKEPQLLTASGVILHGDRLARLDAAAQFPWIALLRRDEEIRVPFEQRGEVLEILCRTGVVTQAELPENLRFETLHPTPHGRLQLKKPQYGRHSNQLYGTVAFLYNDVKIAPDDERSAMITSDSRQVIQRDLGAERLLWEELAECGASVPANSNFYGERHDVEVTQKRLHQVVQNLVRMGWSVEAEGGLIRQAGEFRLSVTSGVDWFLLDGEFDFGKEQIRLPELLAAIRRGDRYVKLGDGTQGMLPEAWLAKFEALADLGQTEAGELRFRPTQALLLDALLASQPQVSFDKKFTAIRAKLQSFRGVQPAAAPLGFTGQLRDYQKEGLGWFDFLREFGFGGCLADDMGLGKTIQVLALLEARRTRRLKKGETRRPALVVVPRSLVFNWMQEARTFTPELRVLDFAQKGRGPLLEQLDQHDLIITTYGTLLRDITKLKNVTFDYAILDESQAIKNAQSQSAKACRLLQADNRLALTGTPIENHLGELWSLFEFLNPGMLGHSAAFQRFSKNAPTLAGTDDPAAEETRTAMRALSQAVAPFMLRRTKEQVLKELPEKTEQTIFCDLSKKERKHYDELRDFYRASLSQRIATDGIQKSKIHVLEALLRLRQAACHVGLVDKARMKESSAKLETLLEQLGEVVSEGHKVLVFSQFTSLLAIVKAQLDAQKMTYEYLDGRTRDRQSKVDRFQTDPTCPLFLVSLKAGGRGLNLTAADYVFILDPWWNPAVEAQAVDRAHRLGQTKRVFAYRLIARDTVEEKILELQKSKRDIAEAIVSADRSFLQSLTADDLRMLLG